MPDLSTIARERTALATIADAIVAASVGKGLWVAVACPPSHLALVDHLTQALHARGRACRCLPPQPTSADAGRPAWSGDGSSVFVITCGLVYDTDHDVERVNINVVTAGLTAGEGDARHREPGEENPAAGGDADITVDYRDPDGPMIRYMAPQLSAGARRYASRH